MDLYEVSRADWLHWFPESRDAPPRLEIAAARFDEETLEWPAYCTFEEARELARRRGMRLLAPREWIRVAIGPRGMNPFPFGWSWQSSYANTIELGLESPAPVGTFESGKSRPYGCYDLLGNVWEWVDGEVRGYSVEPELAGLGIGERMEASSVLGGSYLYHGRVRIYGPGPRRELAFLAQTLHHDHLAPDVGVRHGADAAPYLTAMASEWGRGEATRRRVAAVGRRWADESGRRAVLAELEPLAEAPGAPAALAWLALGARGAGGP